MTDYQELKATLDSPGMKLIVRALRQYHKQQWLEYRKCKTEVELAKVQTAQVMIDTVIPGILTQLLNAHIPEADREKAKKKGEWWKVWEWIVKIRMRERK